MAQTLSPHPSSVFPSAAYDRVEDLRGQLVSFEYDSNSQRDFAVVLSGQEVTVEEVMRKAQHTQRQVGRSALFPYLVSFLLNLGKDLSCLDHLVTYQKRASFIRTARAIFDTK